MTTPSPDDEAAVESTKAPLIAHLVELRKRLVWSLIAFGLCFVVCFFFAKDIFAFLTMPLAHAMDKAGDTTNRHLIATALTETFFTYVKIGMFGGLCLGFPVIASQLYMFVAPGLYKKEKRAFLPFLIASPVFFILGAAFTFYVMMPFGIEFFLGFQTKGTADTLSIQLEQRTSEYLDFVMTLIIAFGITFQMPVLLGILGRIGILRAKQLRDFRRYAIVAITAVAAFFTPPDPFSMLSLIFPLLLLYELSILIVALFEKRRAKEDAAREAAR